MKQLSTYIAESMQTITEAIKHNELADIFDEITAKLQSAKGGNELRKLRSLRKSFGAASDLYVIDTKSYTIAELLDYDKTHWVESDRYIADNGMTYVFGSFIGGSKGYYIMHNRSNPKQYVQVNILSKYV